MLALRLCSWRLPVLMILRTYAIFVHFGHLWPADRDAFMRAHSFAQRTAMPKVFSPPLRKKTSLT